jgi:hypothetical protein
MVTVFGGRRAIELFLYIVPEETERERERERK